MSTETPPSDAPVQYGTVTAVERLSPSMIRVVFGGPGLKRQWLAEQALDA